MATTKYITEFDPIISGDGRWNWFNTSNAYALDGAYTHSFVHDNLPYYYCAVPTDVECGGFGFELTNPVTGVLFGIRACMVMTNGTYNPAGYVSVSSVSVLGVDPYWMSPIYVHVGDFSTWSVDGFTDITFGGDGYLPDLGVAWRELVNASDLVVTYSWDSVGTSPPNEIDGEARIDAVWITAFDSPPVRKKLPFCVAA